MDFPFAKEPAFRRAVDRLRRITGFVSTLHPPGDPRPLAFGRYFHVRRVAWLAARLVEHRLRAGWSVDARRVARLAWAHDLNRWPFAHLSEQGVFDQAADVLRFFDTQEIVFPTLDLHTLVQIVSKSAEVLPPEGEIVLLADMLTGLLEDPLIAITGLRITPDFVQDDVAENLGLPLRDHTYRKRLFVISERFYTTRDVHKFMHDFDRLFQDAVDRFDRVYRLDDIKTTKTSPFGKLRSEIVSTFLMGKLFIYNNEKISHGSRLRAAIVQPLLATLGANTPRVLTTIDEADIFTWAVRNGIIREEAASQYFPDLDYIAKYEPALLFRR